MQTMSINSLLQNGLTHIAASATGDTDDFAPAAVYRVTGQRIESTLIFEREQPM
jgi:hypothetical protein